MKTHQKGFTLIEAAITIAILAIIVAIGLPTYQSAVGSARIGDVQTDLNLTITAAMRHAMVSSTPVVMCPSRNGEDCMPDINWSSGWIAFSDPDGDKQRGTGDPLVWRQGKLPGGVQMFSTAGRTRLLFHANGDNPGSNTTFTLCHQHVARSKTVMLANNGRIRQSTPAPSATMLCGKV